MSHAQSQVNNMQRAFLFLLVVASALCLASAQISTSNLPTVGQTSNDVEVAAVEPRWVDKNKCTKPGTVGKLSANTLGTWERPGGEVQKDNQYAS
jgi:hypothetical protein